jgi:conjugative transposon TraN protein
MKRIRAVWVLGIFLAFINFKSFAQDAKTALIEPYRLALTFSKTTNLIFPYAIKSIDKGSRDILVQKAIGVENVLQVKAAKPNFAETNLTVVTADGSLFSYVLNYADKPTGINIKVQNAQLKPESVAVFTKDATNDLIQRSAEKISLKRKSANGPNDVANGTSIAIKGLYVQDDVLYFQFALQNYSALNYNIKLFRFFIKDKKKSKRTASQEIEINPIYILGNTDVIRSNSEQVVVVAVPKFTIPDKKVFIVQMQEQNGGRNLQLEIRNKEIFKAWRVQ